jgi:hypothetical protein
MKLNADIYTEIQTHVNASEYMDPTASEEKHAAVKELVENTVEHILKEWGSKISSSSIVFPRTEEDTYRFTAQEIVQALFKDHTIDEIEELPGKKYPSTKINVSMLDPDIDVDGEEVTYTYHLIIKER